MAAVVATSGETNEERGEFLVEALITDDMWDTTLAVGEQAGATYISPSEYALFAPILGGLVRDYFDGKTEITEEEARTFFVRCMLGRIASQQE